MLRCRAFRAPSGGSGREAHVPAEQDPPQSRARVPEADEHQAGPHRAEAPPRQGPEAARGERAEEVAGPRMPPANRRPFSFPKSARLLRRSEFAGVKQRSQGLSEGPLAASWVARPATPTRPGMPPAVARVGLAVSSKVGDAVCETG